MHMKSFENSEVNHRRACWQGSLVSYDGHWSNYIVNNSIVWELIGVKSSLVPTMPSYLIGCYDSCIYGYCTFRTPTHFANIQGEGEGVEVNGLIDDVLNLWPKPRRKWAVNEKMSSIFRSFSAERSRGGKSTTFNH